MPKTRSSENQSIGKWILPFRENGFYPHQVLDKDVAPSNFNHSWAAVRTHRAIVEPIYL